jgi:Zn-dependent M28 family amino/carboxypeptidase
LKAIYFFYFACFFIPFSCSPKYDLNEKNEKIDLLPLYVISSDKLRGRECGSFQMEIAAKYLQGVYNDIGLSKFKGIPNYFQDVSAYDSTYLGKNIIGFIEGTDSYLKDEYLVISAHYDHLGVSKHKNEIILGDSIYNGARDNAVGVNALIEIARHFTINPPKRSVIFACFTAEEIGYLGSDYFVSHLPISFNKIVFNFNIDNVGYNNISAITVLGMGRTTIDSVINNKCGELNLRVISNPNPELNLYERSDNVSFVDKGIPSVTYCMGFDSIDSGVRKNYHTVLDNLNSLDLIYVKRYINSSVFVAERIANVEARPAWAFD